MTKHSTPTKFRKKPQNISGPLTSPITGLALFAAMAIALLYWSPQVSRGVAQGLELCAVTVIPSLFPFLVFSLFLAISPGARLVGRLFAPLLRRKCLPEDCGVIWLMSLLGGYPSGAQLIAAGIREGRISQKTGERLLCCSVNPGPSFVMAGVGLGMLGSLKAGACLLAAQAGASLTVALWMLLRARNKREALGTSQRRQALSYVQALPQAIAQGSENMLRLCGSILVFSGVRGLLEQWLVPILGEGQLLAGTSAALEVVSGCKALAGLPTFSAMLMLSFFLAFGGGSVLLQTVSLFAGISMDWKPFLFSRLINGILAAGYCFLLREFWQEALQEAFLQTVSSPPVPAAPNQLLLSLSLLGICTILLFTADTVFLGKKE